MHALAATDEPPVGALGRASMGQPRIPRERCRDAATVRQIHRERVVADGDACAHADQCSMREVVIPAPLQVAHVLLHRHDDTCQLAPRDAAALLKPNGIKPGLGAIRIALNVYVRGLGPVTDVEEESVRTNAEDGRHRSMFIMHAAVAIRSATSHITWSSAAAHPKRCGGTGGVR